MNGLEPAVTNLRDGSEPHLAFGVDELAARVKRALSGAFPAACWWQGYITARSGPKDKGQVYFTLSAHPSAARNSIGLDCVVWRDARVLWDRKPTDLVKQLELGLEVRAYGKVAAWKNAPQLQVEKIDWPGSERQATDIEVTVGRLSREGLLSANRQKLLPKMPVRIGLVSSPDADGRKDAHGVLSSAGYAFKVRDFPTRVQGHGAADQIASAVTAAGRVSELVLLVRGGGSQGDLAAFDALSAARAVARCPVPVFTGIGHRDDASACDNVAHTPCMTPTHAAEEVVRLADEYHHRLDAQSAACDQSAARLVRAIQASLDRSEDSCAQRLRRCRSCWQHAAAAASAGTDGYERSLRALGSRGPTGLQATRLDARRGRAQRAASRALTSAAQAEAAAAARLGPVTQRHLRGVGAQLRAADARVEALRPERLLERGWAIVRHADGAAVRSVFDAEAGERLTVTLADGALAAKVCESVRETV